MPRSGWAVREPESSSAAALTQVYMSYLAPTGDDFYPLQGRDQP